MYEEFSKWINNILKQLPKEAIAVNFNLYEGAENYYHIQLIGTNIFDENDEDWACEEVFSTEENLFKIPRTSDIKYWKDGLLFIKNMVKKYLEYGKYKNILLELKGVGIGFVDGDIEILHMTK